MSNKAKVFYEWDVEWVDEESFDIIEHDHAEKLEQLSHYIVDDKMRSSQFRHDAGVFFRLVLVRDLIEPNAGVFGGGGVLDRSWCYLTSDGTLPETTDSGYKIPKKYIAEFEKNKSWASKLGNRQPDDYDWIQHQHKWLEVNNG